MSKSWQDRDYVSRRDELYEIWEIDYREEIKRTRENPPPSKEEQSTDIIPRRV